jgi:hypothetical protein
VLVRENGNERRTVGILGNMNIVDLGSLHLLDEIRFSSHGEYAMHLLYSCPL